MPTKYAGCQLPLVDCPTCQEFVRATVRELTLELMTQQIRHEENLMRALFGRST